MKNDEQLNELKEKLLTIVERTLNAEEKIKSSNIVNELLHIVEKEYDI